MSLHRYSGHHGYLAFHRNLHAALQGDAISASRGVMMPEAINRQVTGDLPVFPAGEGKGGVFSPLPNDVKEGKLRAHAMQAILVAPQALYELWRDVESAPLWMECLVSVNLTGALLKHVENGGHRSDVSHLAPLRHR